MRLSVLHTQSRGPTIAFTALVLALSVSGCIRTISYAPPDGPIVVLDQGWSHEDSVWYDHAPQGGVIMPTAWFLAVEQPAVKLGAAPLFSEPAYLERFGFLPTLATPEDMAKGTNPHGLPVGFATQVVTDPLTGASFDALGLTCAACHTGQIEYQGTAVRIAGGGAIIDPGTFEEALGLALFLTDKLPGRFGRFADRVLGADADAAAVAALRKQVRDAITAGRAQDAVEKKMKINEVKGGYGRTDALAKIGNYVFGERIDNKNLRPADAPVNLPHIWDTPWFDRVQYNGAIVQPMVRNVGEALGLRALVNLKVDNDTLYQSSINIEELHQMEEQISGKAPFQGLVSPKWPAEVLGPIDTAKARRGEALYGQFCERCHLPPLGSEEMRALDADYWSPADVHGRQYLTVTLVNLAEIGTDEGTALNFYHRVADTEHLDKGLVSAGEGLALVTEEVTRRYYDDQNFSAAKRLEYDGYREMNPKALLVYKARPLDGIWATPPYLHNGAVANLYQMLVPVEQRDKCFFVGAREFDPVNVGYRTEEVDGAFELCTDTTGNSNAGHEFREQGGAEYGDGIIGRELTDEERWAIVEYLKTL